MSKLTPKQPKTRPADALVKPLSQALTESALERVSGGKVTMSDFSFTQKVDKASPGF